MAMGLRSLLATPLDRDGKPWGALYLENPGVAGAFTLGDERFVEAVTGLLSPLVEARLGRPAVDGVERVPAEAGAPGEIALPAASCRWAYFLACSKPQSGS